jgi:hypothetical protein
VPNNATVWREPVNDANREPLTIGPKPGAKVSITLGELISAVMEYLWQKSGIRIGRYGIEPDEDLQQTTVEFHGVILPDGTRPYRNMLSFDVDGVCSRSENARIGGNLRPVAVRKHRAADVVKEFKEWQAKNRLRSRSDWDPIPGPYETIADLVAEPNADRSITFFVIDHLEGNTYYFRRPNAQTNKETKPSRDPDLHADRLTRPATVTCPSLQGEPTTFHVVIEKVYWRTEPGEDRRLCFRGKAGMEDWSGHKTFFVDECSKIVDETTGASIPDIPSWLLGMIADPTPLTLKSLINAVCPALITQLNIKFKDVTISCRSNGGHVIIISNISRFGDADTSATEAPPQELALPTNRAASLAIRVPASTVRRTDLTEALPQELSFVVPTNRAGANLDDPLGLEKADIKVIAHWGGQWDGPDVRTVFSATVMACEAGRVDVRQI